MGKIWWISTLVVIFVWSAIEPKDQFTWFLEVLPVIIGFAIMAYTYDSFRLTNILYILILIHMIILMIGGHYTCQITDGIKEWDFCICVVTTNHEYYHMN